MNKSTYGQIMKLMCDEAMSYKYTRTGERISIDGGQATITSDVAESFVSNGRNIVTKVRDKAVIELIDGLIEALETQEARFEVGVQWHPEMLIEDDPGMHRLFDSFIEAAAVWRQTRRLAPLGV